MKKHLVIIVMISMAATSHAQGGFFNQKATQTQLLKEQIAALQVYMAYLQKANTIAKEGTGLIDNLKNADLKLHAHFFDSLSQVKAGIRNYPKVKAVRELRGQLMNDRTIVSKQINSSAQFSARELNALKDIYDGLEHEAGQITDELDLVVTDGVAKLSDDERVAKIDKLYSNMQLIYARQRKLNRSALSVAVQRGQAAKDAQTLRRLYGQH